MKKTWAFIFLMLYGCVVMAAPVTEHECYGKAFQKEQHQTTHSCCNQQAKHKGCCPDHQCNVRTDDNAVEIVAYKEFNPQFQLFDLLSAGEKIDQNHLAPFVEGNTISFSLHKIRIHLYNRVLLI